VQREMRDLFGGWRLCRRIAHAGAEQPGG
jgi:hypothetical protein